MSEAVAVPAESAVAARAPAPTGAEVLAAGLAAIALAVMQLVLRYGLPLVEWKAYHRGAEMPGVAQLLVDVDHLVGDGRWVLAAAWLGAVFALRRRRWRGGFVIGTALLAIAGVALALTLGVLSCLTFVLPEG